MPHPHSRWLKTGSLFGLWLGVAVRLVQYLSNRSLWFDEVAIVLNLQARNYTELLGALSYNQAAPPFFLWIEEFALNTLGNHEYALRLYPLIGGLLSLAVFYRFTQTFTDGWARPIAILLFSVLSYIAYFAGEVKPYSWDVTLGLLLFMAIAPLATFTPRPKQLVGAGLLGTLSIWLSFPSILVMAAVEATNLIQLKLWQASLAEWRSLLVRRVPLYAVWLASLIGLYVINVSETLAETDLASGWADRYPDSWFDLLWLLDAFGQFFYQPLGFRSPADGLSIVAFIIGFVYLYRTHRWRLAYLCSPFVVTILASYLHKYPFRNRLIVFLTPYALAILAEGISLLIRRWRKGPKVIGVMGLALAALLLLQPLGHTLAWVVKPERAHFDDVRPAIAHIQKHWQPGDKVYVFRWAQLQFSYYQPKFSLSQNDVILAQIDDPSLFKVEERDLQQLSEEIDQLKATELKNVSRVWFLLARKDEEDATAISSELDRISTSLERTYYPDVVLSLQALSN